MCGENLDGDGSVQTRIARSINLAHATRADRARDLVRAELCSGW